ncbi:MAG: hypothetical protein LJE95_05715 [Acidobacteria bacterium]|nr:hypothetical protein [Acidobacteriota bacterium]
MNRSALVAALTLALVVPMAVMAQLSPAWMIPAAAHTRGVAPTFWMTDVNLHNPHSYDLPVVVQLLPSNRDNGSQGVPTLDLTLGPWQTANLWDALGTDLLDWYGTGALLVYADQSYIDCSDPAVCDFLATSRTYTLDPVTVSGEFGQALPGVSVDDGLDRNGYAYAAGVMNDGDTFRCNPGVASWTDAWVTVQMDVQDADGTILDTEVFDVPPFGHLQRRMRTAVSGGSVVFYIPDTAGTGPSDSLVFPYVTVVNQRTGDPTFVPTWVSEVGVTVASVSSGGFVLRGVPLPADGGKRISREQLAQRSRSRSADGQPAQ